METPKLNDFDRKIIKSLEKLNEKEAFFLIKNVGLLSKNYEAEEIINQILNNFNYCLENEKYFCFLLFMLYKNKPKSHDKILVILENVFENFSIENKENFSIFICISFLYL